MRRVLLAVMLCLVMDPAWAGVGSVAAPAAALKPCRAVDLASHQGSTLDGDANTLPALLGAVSRGADTVETDVRVTKDGGFVLMHDANVSHTTNGTGLVADLTVRQISRLRTKRMHNRVPTLGRALAALRDTRATARLELKQPGTWPAGTSDRLLAVVDARGMTDRVVLYTIHRPTLQWFHDVHPERQTAWKPAARTEFAPLQASQFTDGMVFLRPWMRTRKVTRAHLAGLTVLAKLTNRSRRWQQAVRVGVDSILTDDVSGYVRWCRRQ